MPNFKAWTDEHAKHKLRVFLQHSPEGADGDGGGDGGGGAAAGGGGGDGKEREDERIEGVHGSVSIPWGRLWRYQYWECLRVPCHEVIHLLQHVQKQSANVQVNNTSHA